MSRSRTPRAFSPLSSRVDGPAGSEDAPPEVESALAAPGRPLDGGTRAAMEAGFGRNFSAVRVHTDGLAAASASAVGARAYAVGHDVVFGAGEYRLGSPDGRRLLAHELAHTVQQGASAGSLAVQRGPLAPASAPPAVPKPGQDRPRLPGVIDNWVLALSPAEFEVNEPAQDRLFEMAQAVRSRQQTFGEDALGVTKEGGDVTSILKRNSKGAFVSGVVAKCKRNGYRTIGQMDDMVRGRFDLNGGDDVYRVARYLLYDLPIQASLRSPVTSLHPADVPVVVLEAAEAPRREVEVPECTGGGHGYPRFHVIVMDPETSITHEWQIGTESVSRVYELHGVKLPPGMDLDFELGRIGADLHDIDYDIFRQGVKKHSKKAYSELELDVFGHRLDMLSAKAHCVGVSKGEIEDIQDAAADRLEEVVDRFGIDQVREWYH